MIIHNIVLHQIDKQADSGPSVLFLNPQTLDSSAELETFLEQLNQIYNSKPSKLFGRFLPASQETEGSTEENTKEVKHHPELLKKFIAKELDFLEYTQQAMNILKFYIDQASKATGGYIAFIHYTLFGNDYVFIVMLNNATAMSINAQLKLNPIEYLDLSQLHLAARIDLTMWQEEPHSERYISTIKGRESNKLSEYFKLFIAYEELIDSKKETAELLGAVSQFCTDTIDNDEGRIEFKKKASDFCLEQADKGENIKIKDFSGYMADGAVDDFMNYIKSEQIPVNNEVSPNKSMIRKFNKISGRNQQISITINEDASILLSITSKNKADIAKYTSYLHYQINKNTTIWKSHIII